ncbi:MAG: DUF4105 domain-containing protein [Deltaproteobacteria bacterium]|nr:MAG: DUF4105 domain-containing protein [Deltaproteobacteria bacterium]
MRWLRGALLVPLAIVLAGALGWAGLALWFDGPAARPLAGALAAGVVVGVLALLILVRPMRRALGAVLVYRSETDFTERWEDRTYDLSHLQGADLFLSFWGPTLIAHTILSWEFDDGKPLAISIETRKERGEEYSALRGFFRQYELYYVVADERDVVRLRTNYRGERVFLYRLRGSPALARRLLVSYLDQINRLARTPQWYNALTQNCTTTIRFHAQQAAVRNPLDWRLFANGRGDELLYERGDIDTSLPLAALRTRSDITAKARAADQDGRFSDLIREGIPSRPDPRR